MSGLDDAEAAIRQQLHYTVAVNDRLAPRANGVRGGCLDPIPGGAPRHPVESDRASVDPPAALRPGAIRLSDVKAERVDWLWPGYIPKGKLIVLDGDPSVGKSTLAIDIAARITRGSPMPDGSGGGDPRGVVLLAAEDGLADTVKPRLLAANAATERVIARQTVYRIEADTAHEAMPTIQDVDALRDDIKSCDAVLVIVDVLMAYLPGGVNSHRDQDIRRALAPLTALATETGVTILCLRHLNKGSGGEPLYRGGGSIGIIGAARAGLIAAFDPTDDARTKRVLAVSKLNVGIPGPAWSYEMVSSNEHSCARINWLEPTHHSAIDLVVTADSGADRSARVEAEEFICDALADGPITAVQLQRSADETGIAPATFNRARSGLKKAGVIQRAKVGMNGGWEWRLSPTEDDHSGPKMLNPSA